MFEHIIGNEKVKKELENILASNKISHSYLFIGIDGIGKKLFAREFAKAILCNEQNKYCDKCKSCLEFNTNNNPDYGEIIPEGNSIKIDQIREMQRKISESPIISNKKVYIIDNAHLMTKEAQNALLKTLEEPPDYLAIILISANESNLLSTIISRCLSLKFSNIQKNQIEKYLKEKFNFNVIQESIIEASNGSIGNAEKLINNEDTYNLIERFICNIKNLDLIDCLKKADFIYKMQEEKNGILDYIIIILYKKAKEDLKYLNCINIVEDTKRRLKSNCNYNMTIDNMIIAIWEEIY